MPTAKPTPHRKVAHRRAVANTRRPGPSRRPGVPMPARPPVPTPGPGPSQSGYSPRRLPWQPFGKGSTAPAPNTGFGKLQGNGAGPVVMPWHGLPPGWTGGGRPYPAGSPGNHYGIHDQGGFAPGGGGPIAGRPPGHTDPGASPHHAPIKGPHYTNPYHVTDKYAGSDISLANIAKRSKAKTGKLPSLAQARKIQQRDLARRKAAGGSSTTGPKPTGTGTGSDSAGGGVSGGGGGSNLGSGDLLGGFGVSWVKGLELVALAVVAYFAWTKVIGPRVGRKLRGKR